MKILFLIVLSVIITSCIGAAAHQEELVANYTLGANDVRSGMSISYGKYRVGIILPTVFAVGFNNDFIIAKQHPEDFPNIDKTITNYFIIPIKNKVSESAEKNVIGPLTINEFNKKRIELGIPKELTFTKVVSDLE